MIFIPFSAVQIEHTATSDTKFQLSTAPMWFSDVNIHVLTHDARYGDTNITSGNPSITAGNGLSYRDINIQDLFFMNSSAGDNTKIIAIGAIMTEARKKELGVF